jgi:hypothetical protein
VHHGLPYLPLHASLCSLAELPYAPFMLSSVCSLNCRHAAEPFFVTWELSMWRRSASRSSRATRSASCAASNGVGPRRPSSCRCNASFSCAKGTCGACSVMLHAHSRSRGRTSHAAPHHAGAAPTAASRSTHHSEGTRQGGGHQQWRLRTSAVAALAACSSALRRCMPAPNSAVMRSSPASSTAM